MDDLLPVIVMLLGAAAMGGLFALRSWRTRRALRNGAYWDRTNMGYGVLRKPTTKPTGPP